MINIDIEVDTKEAIRNLSRFAKLDIPYIQQGVLNDLAFDARKSAQAGMTSAFESVSRFTRGGVQVKKATKANLTSIVFIEQKRLKYLGYQLEGGTRLPQKRYIAVAKGLGVGGRSRKRNLTQSQIQNLLARRNVT